MVHEIAPFGVEDLSIWFDFDAEIVRKENYNGDTFDLAAKVYHRDLCVDHCDCSTGELYISSRNLPNADAELKRYLEESYPEYEFRHIEVTGYRIRS